MRGEYILASGERGSTSVGVLVSCCGTDVTVTLKSPTDDSAMCEHMCVCYNLNNDMVSPVERKLKSDVRIKLP